MSDDDAVMARPRGKGRARVGKGRPLDEAALDEVRAVIMETPLRRDRLIEYLHLLQDRFGALRPRHLHALAAAMGLAQAEVFEVASFYHHFDVIADDAPDLPPVTVRVCDSISCMLAGAEALVAALIGTVDPREVRVVRGPCIGRCAAAPAAQVGQRAVDHATVETIAALAAEGATVAQLPEYETLSACLEAGGYRAFVSCQSGAKSREETIAALSDAGLRGLGGAGFPAGRKWAAVAAQPAPRLMTVNADEGEPGTFKDRWWLERTPHRMLEGMLIAAWAVAVERIYIYLRDEYPAVREILRREIAALEGAGLVAPGFIELRRGAGAYICGEESAMIESIEGKRGLPRHRPPYIAEVGLFGRPTLNHNVETLAWIPDILSRGADWFTAEGRRGHKGLRSFSVSGRVREPGVKVAPAGITARELIDEFCGGMAEGHAFGAYLPGGASGGILPASLADVPLDFGSLDPHGAFIGSHAVIVLSDKDDLRAVALNLMRFFRAESCGQCTPCRAGTDKMVRLMEADAWDRDLMEDLSTAMRDASICGLGQAAPNPVRSILAFFNGTAAGAGGAR
ncbi:NAD-dependent formate dehydrogenase flavoprotein subunit [Chelatococcus sambhunathii]|uniref:NAD-dependent formate dehydrogenase flavoprotein subunit n=1 Tax=Chelatococcus sambhunathii TaxID=363953 RepID=A0ABM9U9B0_9HYPH|nr:NADH-ubiquinone oxidoreductase-F iron-sulfur binding region domain-containing protein [Chelatococcus sambhunathii]CUA90795.1 NAD-dependent formate dehydrogenase flavoprotein subunit [Chelatococcus sambhunathii]